MHLRYMVLDFEGKLSAVHYFEHFDDAHAHAMNHCGRDRHNMSVDANFLEGGTCHPRKMARTATGKPIRTLIYMSNEPAPTATWHATSWIFYLPDPTEDP